MIKYSLRCDQNHEFEGWFRNSDDCGEQTRAGHLQCPMCGSTSVSKSLMAPRVSGTRTQDAPKTDSSPASRASRVSSPTPVVLSDRGNEFPGPKKVQEMLQAFRKHVVENSDYVGDKFAEEARKIHFEEAEPRGIYGEATIDEVAELAEEGVDCLPLPRLPEEQN